MSQSKADESTRLASPGPRQQYHYLYGSSSSPDRQETPVGASSPLADQDSLAGEALVLTDNEQDLPTPCGSDSDLQQLLLSNGNGVHVLGGDGSHRHKSDKSWALFCAGDRKSQPLLYVVALTGTASILCFIFAMVLFPNSLMGRIGTRLDTEIFLNMPFERVDRGDYGDPISKFMDKSLFDPSLLSRKGPKEFIFPFPTGNFWVNLVLPATADRGLSFPVVVYPYAYKWSETLMQVSYPASHREEEPKMIHDYFFPDLTFGTQEGTLTRRITHFDALSVSLRYTTQNGKWESYLVQGSPYITIRYENSSPEIHAFSAFTNVGCPNNQGSGNRRRKLGDMGFGVCGWEEDSTGMHRTLKGVQFRIASQEGMDWILFSSEPIELQFDLIGRATIASTSKFKGVLRIAHIPSPQSGDSNSAMHASAAGGALYTNATISTGLQRLIYHAGVYPVRGDVSWTFRSVDSDISLANTATSIMGKSSATANDGSSFTSSSSTSQDRIATLTFSFMTETFTSSSSASSAKPLLMLALPHHAQLLPSNMQLGRDQFDLVFKCIKGPMRPTVGRVWSYDERLSTIGFDDFDVLDNRRKGYLHPSVRPLIIESLKSDINLALPTLTENVYGFGKQTARLAQLAHIAYMLQEGNAADFTVNQNRTDEATFHDDNTDVVEVYLEAVRLLRYSLEQFLDKNASDVFVFDQNLGGLVSSDGLRDSGADFGNGRYNDHHLQYGRILYACAVLGNIDRDFVVHFGDAIDAVAWDIAHDRNFASEKSDHVYFPGARHKVWFDGHSYASGMFPFGNGKSQESSSEAVNGYFGAYLWSLVKHNAIDTPSAEVSSQTDFARLLLATEIRGAQMYWHMVPPSNDSRNASTTASASVYSPDFSRNYMVGNVGMLDVVSSTWFGTSSLYVHMINEMPVTAITSKLFNAKYVEEEYTKAIKPLGEVEMAWRGYVVCNHALINPQGAWAEALELRSGELDSGTSKSHILYFISTREGFDATKLSFFEHESHTQHESHAITHDDGSACAANIACRQSDLTGLCCPTDGGVFLECCSYS
jgi:endoglucanase Acf2